MFTPLSYWQRHLRNLVRYGTIRKYANLARAYAYYVQGASTISTKPVFLRVEICRYCEMNCLYCYPAKAQLFYPLVAYKQLIDQFKDFIFSVSLYDIGEPFLNPQVLEYVDYAHKNRVGTVISTSLSFERDDGFWESLVASGLDYLVVAIDGVTPEVYNRYRQNGRLELVMSNLKKLLAARDRLDAQLFVEWQMIDFDWNRSEQKMAKELADQLGCNYFRIIAEATQPRKAYDGVSEVRSRNCLLPYILFFVTANNDVRLCYKIYHHDMRIGSLSSNTFEKIWNGDEIARVRDREQIAYREGCQKCKE